MQLKMKSLLLISMIGMSGLNVQVSEMFLGQGYSSYGPAIRILDGDITTIDNGTPRVSSVSESGLYLESVINATDGTDIGSWKNAPGTKEILILLRDRDNPSNSSIMSFDKADLIIQVGKDTFSLKIDDCRNKPIIGKFEFGHGETKGRFVLNPMMDRATDIQVDEGLKSALNVLPTLIAAMLKQHILSAPTNVTLPGAGNIMAAGAGRVALPAADLPNRFAPTATLGSGVATNPGVLHQGWNGADVGVGAGAALVAGPAAASHRFQVAMGTKFGLHAQDFIDFNTGADAAGGNALETQAAEDIIKLFVTSAELGAAAAAFNANNPDVKKYNAIVKLFPSLGLSQLTAQIADANARADFVRAYKEAISGGLLTAAIGTQLHKAVEKFDRKPFAAAIGTRFEPIDQIRTTDAERQPVAGLLPGHAGIDGAIKIFDRIAQHAIAQRDTAAGAAGAGAAARRDAVGTANVDISNMFGGGLLFSENAITSAVGALPASYHNKASINLSESMRETLKKAAALSPHAWVIIPEGEKEATGLNKNAVWADKVANTVVGNDFDNLLNTYAFETQAKVYHKSTDQNNLTITGLHHDVDMSSLSVGAIFNNLGASEEVQIKTSNNIETVMKFTQDQSNAISDAYNLVKDPKNAPLAIILSDGTHYDLSKLPTPKENENIVRIKVTHSDLKGAVVITRNNGNIHVCKFDEVEDSNLMPTIVVTYGQNNSITNAEVTNFEGIVKTYPIGTGFSDTSFGKVSITSAGSSANNDYNKAKEAILAKHKMSSAEFDRLTDEAKRKAINEEIKAAQTSSLSIEEIIKRIKEGTMTKEELEAWRNSGSGSTEEESTPAPSTPIESALTEAGIMISNESLVAMDSQTREKAIQVLIDKKPGELKDLSGEQLKSKATALLDGMISKATNSKAAAQARAVEVAKKNETFLSAKQDDAKLAAWQTLINNSPKKAAIIETANKAGISLEKFESSTRAELIKKLGSSISKLEQGAGVMSTEDFANAIFGAPASDEGSTEVKTKDVEVSSADKAAVLAQMSESTRKAFERAIASGGTLVRLNNGSYTIRAKSSAAAAA